MSLRVPLTSGVAGGGVVAAAVLGLGLGHGTTKTTTVVAPTPVTQSGTARNASVAEGTAVTPRQIYKRVAPGVVFVRASVVQRSQSPFGPAQQRGEATGSGFVIDRDGDILTNAHVVDGAVKVSVQVGSQHSVAAKVVGKDVSTDVALLKVDPDGIDLQPLRLGSATSAQVGDPVLAIGNPFGLDRTLTTGVVSAKQRQIQAPNGFAIDNVIQTDAAINPGNSGGPLLDAAGRVIGINSQIETGGSGGGNVGIGFAVPIDTAEKVLPRLKQGGNVQVAYLGVSSQTIDSSLAGLDLPVRSGALVQSVRQGSPAAKAGLRAGSVTAQLDDGTQVVLGGDIVTAIDGRAVRSSDDVANRITAKKPGDTVKVTVRPRPGDQDGPGDARQAPELRRVAPWRVDHPCGGEVATRDRDSRSRGRRLQG